MLAYASAGVPSDRVDKSSCRVECGLAETLSPGGVGTQGFYKAPAVSRLVEGLIGGHNLPEHLINRLQTPRLALPDRDHSPAEFLKARNISPVTFHVRGELARPELLPRRRNSRVPAPRMSVPEATMHEHHSSIPAQDDVRPARQMLVVQPKAQAGGMQVRAHRQFRFGVPALDASHHSRARLLIHHVGQGPLPA